MEADAVYDFVANADDELGFKKGTFLKVCFCTQLDHCRFKNYSMHGFSCISTMINVQLLTCLIIAVL
ncbi:hypothetical protein PHET_12481 [Paragonimus heterotremus]|uniref:SH3 domain-containing protein n=1 Tax=Paragonimus heterotremus TaxID=100268 RepID=A0A8J4SJ54_9TREM|nr:hypothetical protein PHET_12481 [Paragonimus heterotremus]